MNVAQVVEPLGKPFCFSYLRHKESVAYWLHMINPFCGNGVGPRLLFWIDELDLILSEVIHDIKVFDVADPQKACQGYNSHATPTPVVEDGRVKVHYGAYGTACLDTKSGKEVWLPLSSSISGFRLSGALWA